MSGAAIRVAFQDHLSISGRKLLSRGKKGTPVSAASFLLDRKIILDRELLRDASELRRILIHELFHFVWRRIGNNRRAEWDHLLSEEQIAGAKGDLGWSAEWRRNELRAADLETKSVRWREFACETFCDTAAWFYSTRPHPEHTLQLRFRKPRRQWFRRLQGLAPLPL